MSVINSPVTVYGLASSEDGKLRYVGQTRQSLKKRLAHHLYDARKLSKIHKSNWINSVIAKGFEVVIFVIEENAVWAESEIQWIKHYRNQGVDLVNSTNGGEGTLGYVHDEEWRRKKSEAMKGRPSPNKGIKLSEETRLKISLANKNRPPPSQETKDKLRAAITGIKRSQESKEKMSQVQRGRKCKPFTAEHIEKIRITSTGRKHTPESRAKMSASQKGILASAETRALWSLQRTGKLHTEEQKEKISQGLKNAYANGRKSSVAKLSDDDVRKIRVMISSGVEQKSLALQFKVSQSVISEIRHGKSYRNVM